LDRKSVAFSYFAVLFILFFISVKIVMPIVGKELMPPMDTGGVKINVTTDPNLPIAESRRILTEVNRIVAENGKLERLSASIGSEAGVMSMGSGSGIDNISVTATYVNRYERKESIWDIEHHLRPELSGIENVSTPVLP